MQRDRPFSRNSTEQRVLEQATQAKSELSSPVFQEAYQNLCQKYYLEWFNAPADHTKEMAFLKAKHSALGDFMRELTVMIADGERLLAELADKNSPEAKEKRRLDAQGFGLNFDQEAVS